MKIIYNKNSYFIRLDIHAKDDIMPNTGIFYLEKEGE